MNVDAIQSSPASAPHASPASALGRDQFVRLLMTQLGNQDPLSPMDSEAFTAQLAQFATLELQQQQVSTLESLLVAQTSANQTQTATLVGKRITYRSDELHRGPDGTAEVHAVLGGDASSVTVTILDETGNTVRTLQLPAHEAGELTATWDGRDDRGNPVKGGEYHARVTATSAEGDAVDVDTRAQGTASAVSFENGYAELVVNGVRVKLADVTEVREPAPATTTD